MARIKQSSINNTKTNVLFNIWFNKIKNNKNNKNKITKMIKNKNLDIFYITFLLLKIKK